MTMDRLLFGDNQFFGVNHMSEEKARAQLMRFQDMKAVIEVLDVAYDEGVRTFMCTTHDRIGEVCDHVRANPKRYEDFVFYPCMPYAHKYANAMADDGMLGAIKRFLPDGGKDAFRIFADHVRAKYGAEPGFITMNLPKLLDVLEEVGIDNPIVCSNINQIGFRMCGGVEAYERAMRERRFRPIAMSVFASGAIPASEALEWVCRQPNLESIVFGASSRGNIRNTRDLVNKLWPAREPAPEPAAAVVG